MKTHPSKVIKFCPRCGSKNFMTLNEGRSFTCEDCGFNYYINNSAAVACLIFNDQGKLLLCRRAEEPEKGKLDLPGGFVEPMETAEEAVKREIMEELGVQITKLTYMTSFPNEYIFSGFSVYTLDLAFIGEIDSENPIKAGDDISSVEFHFPKDIPMEELYSDSMRSIISYYQQTKSL